MWLYRRPSIRIQGQGHIPSRVSIRNNSRSRILTPIRAVRAWFMSSRFVAILYYRLKNSDTFGLKKRLTDFSESNRERFFELPESVLDRRFRIIKNVITLPSAMPTIIPAIIFIISWRSRLSKNPAFWTTGSGSGSLTSPCLSPPSIGKLGSGSRTSRLMSSSGSSSP